MSRVEDLKFRVRGLVIAVCVYRVEISVVGFTRGSKPVCHLAPCVLLVPVSRVQDSPTELAWRGGTRATLSFSAVHSPPAHTKMDLPIIHHHPRPFVGAFHARSWSPWFVLGAILWAFIAKS